MIQRAKVGLSDLTLKTFVEAPSFICKDSSDDFDIDHEQTAVRGLPHVNTSMHIIFWNINRFRSRTRGPKKLILR